MRNIKYYFFGLSTVLFITSASVKSYRSKPLFEKIVFIEVSANKDSVLFKPLSKAWKDNWQRTSNLNVDGSSIMNYDKYVFSFNDRHENLWTILHPMIIDGTIDSYYPYNPELFVSRDDGELRYPVMVKSESGTFLNSEKVRENLCYLLGRFGPSYDTPLADQYGEDSMVIFADGAFHYQYPAREFYWYEDEDIIKYKLRVSLLINKNGDIKKRVIKSICPVVNQHSDEGVVGEIELLWLNFEELEPYLKKAFYFDKDWKPKSYLDYFLDKVKNVNMAH